MAELEPNRNQAFAPEAMQPAVVGVPPQDDILPTLFGKGYGSYETKPANFLYSITLHGLAIVLLLLAGRIVVQKSPQIKQYVDTELIAPMLPTAKTTSGGGGGGGNHELMMASKGNLPKMSLDQQITPPVLTPIEKPKLTAEETIVAPPQVNLNPSQLGDMKGIVGPLSSGTGVNGGIGTGKGTGVGSGDGSGLGPGHGGGTGGGYFRIGGGVSPPKPIYQPDPEYSEEARKAKYQGTVVVWIVVGGDGRVHEAKVQRSVGLGLDEKALEAVRSWKFDPAQKDGKPVPVAVNVEVNFRLY